MKIGFDSVPETIPARYFQHLAKLLEVHAPQHEYVVDCKPDDQVDIFHSYMSPMPLSQRIRGARSVVTVPNLNFLRYPHMYTFFDRWVRIRLYKRSCRAARCVIALNRRAKDELAERLQIDERRIQVVMPLAAHLPQGGLDEARCAAVRAKYALPSSFILTAGVTEPRHNPLDMIEALRELDDDTALVVCGRKTSYSNFLIGYARAAGVASRIEFIYEPDASDMPALFRMAQAVVYLPDAEAEASLLPVIEALRAEVPVVLSDIPLHREAAADAAVYVTPGRPDELAGALRCVLAEGESRRVLLEKERVRAGLFSEQAIVQRMMDIYSSL